MAGLLPFVDWFMPSIEEARELTGTDGPAQALQSLGARNVVLTLGGDGMFALLDGGRTLTRKAHRIEVVDTTGCGDCFTAGVIAGLVRGYDIDETLAYATASSALVAQGLGARGKLASDEAVRAQMARR